MGFWLNFVLVNGVLHSAREGGSRAMLGTTGKLNAFLAFLCQKHVQHLVDQYSFWLNFFNLCRFHPQHARSAGFSPCPLPPSPSHSR